MQKTPISLLQRLAKDPCQQDWHRFVELYTPLLFFWARRTGLSKHDAEDVVQDVFASVHRAMKSFQYDGSQSFRSWLKTIVLNKWRDRQRAASRRPTPFSLGEEQIPAPTTEDWFENEYRNLLLKRAMQLVRTEFQTVTWQAFEQTSFENKTPQEVALELGISVNAVYIARSRVLKRLHDELDGLLD
ncbi:MAG: sigma-70 family RNA polymerase sigma factor [Planctomycetales bacterium]|nr:sigma-70 family RNA polymerase sigma factor [Planctomycetales bacterium]